MNAETGINGGTAKVLGGLQLCKYVGVTYRTTIEVEDETRIITRRETGRAVSRGSVKACGPSEARNTTLHELPYLRVDSRLRIPTDHGESREDVPFRPRAGAVILAASFQHQCGSTAILQRTAQVPQSAKGIWDAHFRLIRAAVPRSHSL